MFSTKQVFDVVDIFTIFFKIALHVNLIICIIIVIVNKFLL